MAKGKGKMITVVVPVIIAVVVASALIFVYAGGLAQPAEPNYRVRIRDNYDNLTNNTLELKVFNILAEGYEIIDVTSGVGYLYGDYGSSMNVTGIINGVVDDTYSTINIDEWTTFSAGGLLFEITIELKTAPSS